MRIFYQKIMACIATLFFTVISIADPIIPVSGNDETESGSGFAQTILAILQKEVLPIIIVAGALWILWTGIATMSNGIKEAQDRQKFDPLKNALIKTVIVVVVGGALLYLMDLVRTYTFS